MPIAALRRTTSVPIWIGSPRLTSMRLGTAESAAPESRQRVDGSRNAVVGAERDLEPLRDIQEQLVGGTVAEADRKICKVVEVDRQNRCGPSVAWRANKRGPDAVDEELPIGKTGQCVVERVERES